MAENGVLSAPVVDRVTGQYWGFVDCLDVLRLFITAAQQWLSREFGAGRDRAAMPSAAKAGRLYVALHNVQTNQTIHVRTE